VKHAWKATKYLMVLKKKKINSEILVR
jgi:hypothetical protein